MTKEQYLELHHQVTESFIGLARIALNEGDLEKARGRLDECSRQLKVLFKERAQTIGVDMSVFGEHWK